MFALIWLWLNDFSSSNRSTCSIRVLIRRNFMLPIPQLHGASRSPSTVHLLHHPPLHLHSLLASVHQHHCQLRLQTYIPPVEFSQGMQLGKMQA